MLAQPLAVPYTVAVRGIVVPIVRVMPSERTTAAVQLGFTGFG
jgi:hypothetical protein